MIRAMIATLKNDSVTLEQMTDRDQIAKVIRQGGRRVWVDAADADSAERDWITQTFEMTPAFLNADYPLYRPEHGLDLCVQSVLFHDNHYETLPVIIRATLNTATLITVRSVRIKAIDEVFQRASKTDGLWKDSTAALLVAIVSAVMETHIAALGSIANSYVDTSNALVKNSFPDDLPKLLANVYQWRTDAAQLLDLVEPYSLLMNNLAEFDLITPHQELSELLLQLSMQLGQRQQRAARGLSGIDPLIAVVHSHQLAATAQQTTRLSRTVRHIRALLFLVLPLIAAALGSLVLPVKDDVGFVASLIFLLGLYAVEGAMLRWMR